MCVCVYIYTYIYIFRWGVGGFPGHSDGKESPCKVGDLGLIPGLRRSPAERNGYTLQYSCLENPRDKGAWWATVHRVTNSQTWLSNWHFHIYTDIYVCMGVYTYIYIYFAFHKNNKSVVLVWRFLSTACHIVPITISPFYWNWTGLCFQNKARDPTAANRHSTRVQKVIKITAKVRWLQTLISLQFSCEPRFEIFQIPCSFHLRATGARPPPSSLWPWCTEYHTGSEEWTVSLSFSVRSCNLSDLTVRPVKWGGEVWYSVAEMSTDHSKRSDQSSKVKPKAFSGVRMGSAKGGAPKHRSQCQCRAGAGSGCWRICMANWTIALGCDSLARGVSAGPGTHLPDYCVNCLKDATCQGQNQPSESQNMTPQSFCTMAETWKSRQIHCI